MEILNISNQDIAYLVFAVIAVIVAFLVIKKVAGCLIKTVVFALLLAVMAYLYYQYMDGHEEATEEPVRIEVTE